MSKRVVQYPCQAIFVGPSPATGYHFMDYEGTLNNEYYNLAANHNLLKQLNRIQNISFSLETEREEIRQLGTKSLVDRPNINFPKIDVSFEYLLNGLANDARLGLNVNFAQYYLDVSGTPFYPNNYQVDLLSGLTSRSLDRLITGDPYFPKRMRDNRNIFLVRSEEEGTELQRVGQHVFQTPDTTRGVDPLAPTYEVLAFGQCYLTSYETNGAVGGIPKSKVTFSCENVCFYSSGSGCNVPAINTTTRQLINNNKFNIPETRDEGGPIILNPGDILFSIQPTGADQITGLGLNFNDITIQSYQISMDFNRDLLLSLGHKCPLDREITFPVIANLGLSAVIASSNSGSFIDILNQDSGYNLDIKLRCSPHCTRFPTVEVPPKNYGGYSTAGMGGIEGSAPSSGVPAHATSTRRLGATFIHYAFKKAKLENINFDNNIGGFSTANVSFSVELNPDDLSGGLFISGDLGIDKTEDYLIDESGYYIVDEQMNPIVGNLYPLF